MAQPEWVHDPNAELDYKFDWKALTNGVDGARTDWLDTGETISTYTVTVATGITKVSDSKSDSDTSITVWIKGGTAGTDYDVTCQIVTSDGRTDERTKPIKARER